METKAIKMYESQGVELLTNANAITITDDASRTEAAQFVAATRKTIKVIDEEFKPDIQKAHELHKDLLSRSKRLKEPFQAAQRVVDGKIKTDFLEQDRIRRAEQRKADQEAEAERMRQQEAEDDELSQLIEEGDMEGAEALLESEVVVAPIVPVAKVEKTIRVDGGSITMRKDIEVTVVDKDAIIRAVMAQKLPNTLLDVNVGAAKRYAKAAGITSMPGFRIAETVVSSGRVR